MMALLNNLRADIGGGARLAAAAGLAVAAVACSPFDSGTGGPASAEDAGNTVDVTLPPVEDGSGAAESTVTPDVAGLAPFSFFYTSLAALQRLSGSPNGFGGDLRFGMPTGLEGADKICTSIAEEQGFGAKTWRAFLSATKGPDGQPLNAIDRVGAGPWYDRMGRLIASDKAGLLAGDRPAGDPAAVNDLPDETGQPTSPLGTSYDVITGSTKAGTLFYPDPKNTCMDWSSNTLQNVLVVAGHAWLAGGIGNWISAHPERSCVPGVNLMSNSGSGDGSSIGAAGGWGGFYCFALQP